MKKGVILSVGVCFLLLVNAEIKSQTDFILKGSSSNPPANTGWTKMKSETSGKVSLGTTGFTPEAWFHIKKINTEIGLKVEYDNANYIQFLDNSNFGLYQTSSYSSTKNYLRSNLGINQTNPLTPLHVNGQGLFEGRVGININSAPAAPLHLGGTDFLMEPGQASGNPNAMLFRNNTTNSWYEFYLKSDDGGGGGTAPPPSESAVETLALKITKNTLFGSQLSFTGGTFSGALNCNSALVSNVLQASTINTTTLLHTTAFRFSANAGSNKVLVSSDAQGNASWVDASTLFQAPLELWQQNSNQTIYTAVPAVGIGTGLMGDYKLAVNGKIGCKEVMVEVTSAIWTWPDYVFEQDYHLPHLYEVEAYISKNKHLPGIPSAKEVTEQGLAVGQMQATLLKKVEELTLYIIDQQKSLDGQQKLIEVLGKELEELRNALKQ